MKENFQQKETLFIFDSDTETSDEEQFTPDSLTVSSSNNSDPITYELADSPTVSVTPTPTTTTPLFQPIRLFMTPPSPLPKRRIAPSESPALHTSEIKRLHLAKISFEYHENNLQIHIYQNAPTDWNPKEKIYAARILKRANELKSDSRKKRKTSTTISVNNFNWRNAKEQQFLETWDRRATLNFGETFEKAPVDWTDDEWMNGMRFGTSIATLKNYDAKKKKQIHEEEEEEDSP